MHIHTHTHTHMVGSLFSSKKKNIPVVVAIGSVPPPQSPHIVCSTASHLRPPIFTRWFFVHFRFCCCCWPRIYSIRICCLQRHYCVHYLPTHLLLLFVGLIWLVPLPQVHSTPFAITPGYVALVAFSPYIYTGFLFVCIFITHLLLTATVHVLPTLHGGLITITYSVIICCYSSHVTLRVHWYDPIVLFPLCICFVTAFLVVYPFGSYILLC